MSAARDGLLRAQSFFDAIGYAPTRVELLSAWDAGPSCHPKSDECPSKVLPFVQDDKALDQLINERCLVESRGRIVFRGREDLIREHETRERLFTRKVRRARRVAGWLARLSGVRFVALCNTTALAHADDAGDLDFFVVTRAGSLWQTRGWSAVPFQVLGRRPRPDRVVQDAVCLSFFVDDTALDLSSLQIEDDVYFRHWFLSLLPLYDDGVSAEVWRANPSITTRHPLARPWIVSPDLKVSRFTFHVLSFSSFEPMARRLQEKRFSPAIRSAINRDTGVVVNDHVLKFHVEDGRKRFREAYRQNCQQYGVQA